jgi:endoribonuclease Dicer
MAYRALYDAELLNDNLLPITSVVEPHLDEEVKAMLQDVEKRAGTANVSVQMDPWTPEEGGAGCWWIYELTIEGLPALNFFTRSRHITLLDNKGPMLYRPGKDPVQTWLRPLAVAMHSDERIANAQEYTRRFFWSLSGSRMEWERLDFSYLLLPADSRSMGQVKWGKRRKWLAQHNKSLHISPPEEIFADAELFGKEFLFPTDLYLIRSGPKFSKVYQFVRWRREPVTPEEEEALRGYYKRFGDIDITYPLLVVQPLHPRTNFLLPHGKQSTISAEEKTLLLLADYSTVTLLSPAETQYVFLMPSVLRWLAMARTTHSLRETLFTGSSLYDIPLQLLSVATTAPVAQEKYNYQRLETLGDTVLKFVTGIQLLAEYPLWHEGYLTKKKDHAVSNVRLAKEDIAKGVYRWMIRGMDPFYNLCSPPHECTPSRSYGRQEMET